jgi:nitrate reductase beta subunit
MKIRAQIAMVMNLDKCIGCHTCSVTCKQVWTSRQGMEYAWFNNVETKPGIGYPKDWENQERWKGGWQRKKNGKIVPKQGGKLAKVDWMDRVQRKAREEELDTRLVEAR